MSTDLTPDPEAPLPDANASTTEGQPPPATEVPVGSSAPPPAFPELPTNSGRSTLVMDNLTPFRLRTILLSTLIFGMGGVYLAALNWRRLGKPKLVGPTLILGTLGLIGLTFVYLAIARLANYEGDWIGILAELLGRLTVGGLIIGIQQPDRERWLQLRGNHSPSVADVGGCGVYGQAYVVGFGFSAFMRLIVSPALLTFMSGTTFLTPQLTYSLGSFDVTYDSSWRIYAQDEEASVNCMTQGAVECLLAAENRLGGAAWIVMQVEDAGMSLEEIDELLMTRSVGDYTFGDPQPRRIDGHDAILRDNVFRQANGIQAQVTTVVIEDGADLIIMSFSAYAQDRELTQDRFQRILDSIDFHDTE